MIPFNKPFTIGKELQYIREAVESGDLSGNGNFTKKCHTFFAHHYSFFNSLLTTSCTDALEMAALLCDIKEGDEVIVPSYTFVSTANAFVLRGAVIRLIDSRDDHPGMDEDKLDSLINVKTKVIVPVHYGGVACDMDKIMAVGAKYGVRVVEDAAQAIDSYYTNDKGIVKPLGGIGDLACFSFHETKNVISGEGGLLVMNDKKFVKRAEILWEKGTNRSAFYRGEVDKYGWVDVGSSFLPSELVAAFLYAQLEYVQRIQDRRKTIWNQYHSGLRFWADQNGYLLPMIPEYATNNAHNFYILFKNEPERAAMIAKLKMEGVQAVYHYTCLHQSAFYRDKHDGRSLPNAERYHETLLRLPLYYDLTDEQVSYIIEKITED